MLNNARLILLNLDQLVQVAEKSRGLETGRVPRLPPFVAWLPTGCPRSSRYLKQQHPKIAVTITRCVNHGKVQEALEAGLADVGLIDLYKPQGLDIYPLFF